MSNTRTTPVKRAAQAAKNEALENGVTFTFNGDSYTLPPSDDWDVEVMEHFEDGNPVIAVRALLGEQWGEFKVKNPKVKDITDFADVLGKELGSGNS